MPRSKEWLEARKKAGLCVRCDKPLAKRPDGSMSERYCQEHLEYLKNYRKVWVSENPRLPKVAPTRKCSVCRKVGHNAINCPEAIAAKLGGFKIGSNSNQSNQGS